MAAGRLQRRIVFYGWEDIEGRPQFDRANAAAAVENLQAGAWSMDDGFGYVTGVLVDRTGEGNEPLCLRCFRLRAGDDVPFKLDAARHASPIELEQDEAITDWTHVVIWSDNYAAHDSRRDAPGVNRLAAYLRDRSNESIRFFPLYDRSLIDQLAALDDIKAVDVKIQLGRADQVAQAQGGGLFGGLFAVGQEAEAATITTRVSVGHQRRFLNRQVQDEV